MSFSSRPTLIGSGSTTRAARPAIITAIASLELAAALWDGRIFLKLNALIPANWGDAVSFGVLMPAIMAILAVYAGVGLLQMRRNAWAVWIARHAWLSGVYLLSLPCLLWQSMFNPTATLLITWRLTIVAFSLVAGIILYLSRGQFGNGKTR
jgi:hypothetical protein